MDYKKKMSEGSTAKPKWSEEEKNLLVLVRPRYSSKKWKQISKEFKNHGFERSQIECREKWVNELNPQLHKGGWTAQQLSIMFKTFRQHGSHWSLIEKKLKGRTQNMIKNKFYSLLRNIIRYILRTFHQNAEDTKSILNKLSTKCLQNLYCGEEEFVFVGDLISRTFQNMNYHIDRNKFKQIINNHHQLFKQLYLLVKDQTHQPTAIVKDEHISEESGNQHNRELVCGTVKEEDERETIKIQNGSNYSSQISNPLTLYCSPFSLFMPTLSNGVGFSFPAHQLQ